MTHASDLPDLLTFADGTPVDDPADWPRRRDELLEQLQDIVFGHVPDGGDVDVQVLQHRTMRQPQGVAHSVHRVIVDAGEPVTFVVHLFVPPGEGPWPTIVNGDGCWTYVEMPRIGEALSRGYAVARFDRTEIAPDRSEPGGRFTLYAAEPAGDFGALAAWAWGFHRCVDLLGTVDGIDAGRIAVAGHSRGGKAALLAGATDHRIALAAPNGSGCGGAGCFRIRNDGSETIADIVRVFPFWFTPRFAGYAGRDHEVPVDLHALKAAVAPRALLQTEALGDRWANPYGAWHSFDAARRVYRMLGVEDRVGIAYRHGGHAYDPADWLALLDFADWHFRGLAPPRSFEFNPYR